MAQEAIIITFEEALGGLPPAGQFTPNIKIPDVAKHFGVRCENLFYFMRQMGFKLKA